LDAATSALTDSQDRSSLRSVADDLDVVAVEIEDERAIVVRMVLRPDLCRGHAKERSSGTHELTVGDQPSTAGRTLRP